MVHFRAKERSGPRAGVVALQIDCLDPRMLQGFSACPASTMWEPCCGHCLLWFLRNETGSHCPSIPSASSDEWPVHFLGNCYPFCILGNLDKCHSLDVSMQVTFRIIKTLAVLS